MKNGIRISHLPIFLTGIIFITGMPFVAVFADEPVLSRIESKTLQYTPGNGKVQVTKSIELQADNRYLRSATIQIVSGYNASEDVLIFDDDDDDFRSLTWEWDAKSGLLTLKGVSEESKYQRALRKVLYENTNDVASAGIRTVSFTVIDFWNYVSNTVSRNISITPAGSAPVLSGIETNPVSYCLNGGAVHITSTLTIEDADNTSLSSAIVKISSGYTQNEDLLVFSDQNGITGSWENSSGTLTLSGSATINNYRDALRSITYENSNPENPAATQHTISFTVNDGRLSGNTESRNIAHSLPTATISGSDAICADDNATLRVDLTGNAPWEFIYRRNSGNPVTVSNITESPASITVSSPGNYTLVEVSDNYCPGKVSGTAVISSLPIPKVSISGLDPVYSRQSSEWIALTGTPSGGEFSGPGVIPYGTEWFFIPALPQAGTHNIIYKYRSSTTSCYGYDTAVVKILETSAAIEFEDGRTQICRNDPPFILTGINLLSSNDGTFSINGGVGLVDHPNNTATVTPSQLEINAYTITYVSSDGISVTRDFEVGGELISDFSWDVECFSQGQPIAFTNNTSSPYGFLTGDSYFWKIHINGDSILRSSQDIEYTFQEPGNYKIGLQIKNSYGCIDSEEKNFTLRPVINLAGQNYFDDLETTSAWQTGNSPDIEKNSWQLGSPTQHGIPAHGFTGAFSGANSWYTNITTSPVPREQSWITGPCFDFTDTDKPTLVARVWRLFNDNRDGANIQYSIDNGKTWSPVGTLYDGINWFNSFYGNAGEQSMGWSAVRDADWVETRHSLDFLKDEQLVQFRIAYQASGSAIGNDGIAIDDIGIVERNRTILIEHFTNSSSSESATADSLLDDMVQKSGSNLIDLQYHTSNFPEDPFNSDNPVIPGARQFYYGLSDVPYALINGGMENSQRIDYQEKTLNQNQILIESLYDSDFEVEVTSMLVDTMFYVKAVITSKQAVPETELSVRMVVIEPLIKGITGNNGDTVFRNVVRAMLPNAAGITIYKSWSEGETYAIIEPWQLKNLWGSFGLRAVVFIQNEATKEIYQASLDTPGVFSGSDDPVGPDEGMEFMVYPNPSKGQLTVKLNDEFHEDLTLELFNYVGSLVYSYRIPRGEFLHRIHAERFADGIYLLRISSGQTVLGSTRIVIVK